MPKNCIHINDPKGVSNSSLAFDMQSLELSTTSLWFFCVINFWQQCFEVDKLKELLLFLQIKVMPQKQLIAQMNAYVMPIRKWTCTFLQTMFTFVNCFSTHRCSISCSWSHFKDHSLWHVFNFACCLQLYSQGRREKICYPSLWMLKEWHPYYLWHINWNY